MSSSALETTSRPSYEVNGVSPCAVETTSKPSYEDSPEIIDPFFEEEFVEEDFDRLMGDDFDEWGDADEVLDGIDTPSTVSATTTTTVQSTGADSGSRSLATTQQSDSWYVCMWRNVFITTVYECIYNVH